MKHCEVDPKNFITSNYSLTKNTSNITDVFDFMNEKKKESFSNILCDHELIAMINRFNTDSQIFINYLTLNTFNEFLSNQAVKLVNYMNVNHIEKGYMPHSQSNVENNDECINELALNPSNPSKPSTSFNTLEKSTKNKVIFTTSKTVRKWPKEHDYALYYIYLYYQGNYQMLRHYIKNKSNQQMRLRFYSLLRSVKEKIKDNEREREYTRRKVLVQFTKITKQLMIQRNFTSKEHLIDFLINEVGIRCKNNEVFNKIDEERVLADVKMALKEGSMRIPK